MFGYITFVKRIEDAPDKETATSILYRAKGDLNINADQYSLIVEAWRKKVNQLEGKFSNENPIDMRLVVKTAPKQSFLTFKELRSDSYSNRTGNLIAAYRSHNSDAYCVLTQLKKGNYRAGFIPLNGCNPPRFEAENAYDSIEKATQSGRKVYIFDSQEALLKAMFSKDF